MALKFASASVEHKISVPFPEILNPSSTAISAGRFAMFFTAPENCIGDRPQTAYGLLEGFGRLPRHVGIGNWHKPATGLAFYFDKYTFRAVDLKFY
jgi:hypothetical protein